MQLFGIGTVKRRYDPGHSRADDTGRGEMMRALRVFGILYSLIAAAALAAQGPAAAEGAHGYAIMLTAEASAGAPDLAALARDLAATYGGVLESPSRNGEALIVLMLPERERLAASDPRVQSITEVAIPRHVAADVCSTCWTYFYDGTGNITAAGTDTYRYDTANRLLTATAGGPANGVSYAYDAFGNRTAAARAAGAARCVGNTDCDLSPAANPATNHFTDNGATYDPAGDLVGISGNTFSFDALSMAQSSQLGARTLRYIYTADDERIATYDGTLGTWTLRDLGAHPLREFTSSDTAVGGSISYGTASLTWQRDYIWRGALMLASESRRSYSDPTQVSEHFHLDHLGTPRLVTDDNGSKLGIHTYYPFGGELDSLGYEQPEAELKFTGHARDTGRTGGLSLDDMHARYYSADVGRFLSVDPTLDLKKTIGSTQMWNRYSYVVNNSIAYGDPDGREHVYEPGLTKPYSEWSKELRFDENTPMVVKGSFYTIAALYALPAAVEAGEIAFTAWLANAAACTNAVKHTLNGFTEGPGGEMPSLTQFEQATTQLASELTFTKTTFEHMGEAGRVVPRTVLAQAILTGERTADPQGAKGAIQITSDVIKNGKTYKLTIIYDEAAKRILHFVYK
jgi:RHS repeat-associated protein